MPGIIAIRPFRWFLLAFASFRQQSPNQWFSNGNYFHPYLPTSHILLDMACMIDLALMRCWSMMTIDDVTLDGASNASGEESSSVLVFEMSRALLACVKWIRVVEI